MFQQNVPCPRTRVQAHKYEYARGGRLQTTSPFSASTCHHHPEIMGLGVPPVVEPTSAHRPSGRSAMRAHHQRPYPLVKQPHARGRRFHNRHPPRAPGTRKRSIVRKHTDCTCGAFHSAVAPKPDSPALPTAGAPGRSLVQVGIVGPRAPAPLKSPCCCQVAQQDWLGAIDPYPITQPS